MDSSHDAARRMRAEVSLAAPNAAPIRAQRVLLLEAVGRVGSISGAAREIGLSYRGAWDAICAMNALAGRPLVTSHAGGVRGGGAALTPEGVALVEGFRRLEGELDRAFRSLAPVFGGTEEEARRIFGGLLQTSARNVLRGVVVRVEDGPVSASVALEIAAGKVLTVALTSRSLTRLGLFPGRAAIALVKAPMIALAPGDDGGDNRVAGTVTDVAADDTGVEVTLDIGGGASLCAVLPPDACPFAPGDPAVAFIDPSHIILAVD